MSNKYYTEQTVANYWLLSSKIQQKIKEAHPVTPLYQWRVQGQLNIQVPGRAWGGPIDQVVTAFDATDAANRIANGWAAQYNYPVKIDWLNDGPVVTQVIEAVR